MNRIGFRTLLAKETRRFLKVPGQTLAQPVVTTALYFLVFGFALGGRVREVDGVPYVRFIVPGLVMLSLIQNAFLNTVVVDVHRQDAGDDRRPAGRAARRRSSCWRRSSLAAVVRGLLVGGMVWLVAGALHRLLRRASAVGAGRSRCWSPTTFALIGLAVAIWSDKFEQLNLVPTFVITPLTFLGGVFYSARMLPEPWSTITRAQPRPLHGRGAALRLPRRRVELAPGSASAITGGCRRRRHALAWLDARHRLQAAQLIVSELRADSPRYCATRVRWSQ